MRTSLGRYGEEADPPGPDEELVAWSLADLRDAVGLTADAGRHPRPALGRRPPAVRRRPPRPRRPDPRRRRPRPGLAVCGAAYDGVGIPAVIASAHRAVRDPGCPDVRGVAAVLTPRTSGHRDVRRGPESCLGHRPLGTPGQRTPHGRATAAMRRRGDIDPPGSAPLSLSGGTGGPRTSCHDHTHQHLEPGPLRHDPVAPVRPSRTWALAGIGSGLAGIGVIVTSGMVNAVYDPDLVGDTPAIADKLSEQTGAMFVFHTFATVGAVLLVVFAAGLLPPAAHGHGRRLDRPAGRLRRPARHRGRLRDRQRPQHRVHRSACATPTLDRPGQRRRSTTTGSAPSRGCGCSPASPASRCSPPPASAPSPRWLGRAGLVLGGLTLLVGISPLQYMAGHDRPAAGCSSWLSGSASGQGHRAADRDHDARRSARGRSRTGPPGRSLRCCRARDRSLGCVVAPRAPRVAASYGDRCSWSLRRPTCRGRPRHRHADSSALVLGCPRRRSCSAARRTG